jgi:tRNA(fMet)-specific endonuclease VapC
MAQLAISTVTEAELRFGAARLPGAARLNTAVEEFLLRVDALPWDSKAARYYAELRATLERAGSPMGNLDMMIASHAMSLGAVLATNDRVFRRVSGLQLENWTK